MCDQEWILHQWPVFLFMFVQGCIAYFLGRHRTMSSVPGIHVLRANTTYWTLREPSWQRQGSGGFFYALVTNDQEEVVAFKAKKHPPQHFVVRSWYGWRYLEVVPF